MIKETIERKAPGVRKHPDASSLQRELRRLYSIWTGGVKMYAGDKTHLCIFRNAERLIRLLESAPLIPYSGFCYRVIAD